MGLNFNQIVAIIFIYTSFFCSPIFAAEGKGTGTGNDNKVILNTNLVELKDQNVTSDMVKQDIGECTRAGYDAAKMTNRAYVEHGGCWCKSSTCNYSSFCEGIAKNKKRECLVDKGWTLEDVHSVTP